jgi:hypothetical protein
MGHPRDGEGDEQAAGDSSAGKAEGVDRKRMVETLTFGHGFQIFQTDLEVASHHSIHIDEHSHHFHEVEVCAVHRPGDLGFGSGGRQDELVQVMRGKRLDKLRLDDDSCQRR